MGGAWRQDEIDSQLVQDVSALVEKNRGLLEASVASCDRYCEVLRCVGRYIDARWEPWRGLVAAETRGLVAEVCDVFSVSEQVKPLSLLRGCARACRGPRARVSAALALV